MRSFTHLTLEQRYQIQALMKMGHSYQEIGAVIGVHKSTITREVRRNQGRRGYRPQQAHRFTLSRRRTKVRRRIAAATWHCVNVLLKAEWSPVQISGWLRTQQGTLISPEWIYQHVYRDKRAGHALPAPALSAPPPEAVWYLQSAGSHSESAFNRAPACRGRTPEPPRRLGSRYHDRQRPSTGPRLLNRAQISTESHRQGRTAGRQHHRHGCQTY